MESNVPLGKRIFLGVWVAVGVLLGGSGAAKVWADGSSFSANSENCLVLAEPRGGGSPVGEASADDLPPGKPFPEIPIQQPLPSQPKPSLREKSAPSLPVPEAPEPPETTESVQKLFQAFLETPNRENYLKVLEALTRHASYNPYSVELEEVAQLLEKRRYEEAKAKLDAAMPNLLLSPRAHNYYRVAAEGLGDTQEAQRRDGIAQKCVQGIRSTGHGVVEGTSSENQAELPTTPLLVSRVSDEYDLVRSLGKRVRVHSQSLRRIEDRWYDVLRCSDETGNVFYVWFDVTRPMIASLRQIQKPPK